MLSIVVYIPCSLVQDTFLLDSKKKKRQLTSSNQKKNNTASLDEYSMEM